MTRARRLVGNSSTPLGRLMSAYCQRVGIARESVHFLFAGARITDAQTPADLAIEDGDQIEVVAAAPAAAH